MVSPALVGRGGELSSLVSTVSSSPSVVVIEGEAGIGKTRLLAELRHRLDGSSLRLLTGWCRRIREPFPLAPVIEAVRGLGHELPGGALSPVAGALRPLLPELTDVLPPPPQPLDDRLAERHRVFRAMVEVVGSLGPVVLALEDLHWADEQTVDFLNYLLADLPPKLSLVVTFRGEEVDPAVRALTAKLPAQVKLASLRLRLLDGEETRGLAEAILSGRVSREFSRYLHDHTSGLPFAVEEVLALLRARGALVGRGGRWSCGPVGGLDVPTSIRDSVLERVDRLPPDARLVVEAAAVLQSAVRSPVLVRSCAGPPERTLAALACLIDSGLLNEHGERIGFRHPLAGQAVYEALPVARRRQLHGRAAAALADDDPDAVGQLAHHLRHAGQLTGWVAAAERAADQAARLGHHDEAVRLLADLLRHAPLDTAHRGRVAVALARAAVETLHAEDVSGLLLEVPTGELPREIRGELRFLLALLLNQAGGDPALQRRLFRDAVEELDGRPDLKAWAMIGLGVPAVDRAVSPAEHLQWLDRSLGVVPELADPALQVLVFGKVAMVLTSMGDPRWRQLTGRMQAQTGGTPRRRGEVSAYESVASDACYAGHHQVAGQLLAASAAGAALCQSHRLELRSAARLALLDYCCGRWEGLRERAESLIDELAHYTEGWVDAEVVVGCLALAQGDLTMAERRLTGVVRCVEQAGGLDLLPLPVGALLRLGGGTGEVQPALEVGRRVAAGVDAKAIWAPAARLLPPLIRAMVAGGQQDEAIALVDHMSGHMAALDAPLAPAAVAHARGVLAADQGQWRRAVGHFQAAATRYASLTCPYEAALAREAAAGALFTAGDPAAEHLLRKALQGYRRIGASWDAARAAGAARRHGMALPAVHRGGRRGYGNRLSPREQEVAQLAAGGLTNDEIARQLFLSPKTVDKHVCAALRKLGLHSRRSLAARFPGVTLAAAVSDAG